MALTARNFVADQLERIADVPEQTDACSCGLARQGGEVQAYNEAAFRYFLAIERKRSELSERPFLLLLIDLKNEAGVTTHIDSRAAALVFSSLSLRIRETDFAGWYREDHVIGAVLTQRAEMVSTDVSQLVGERFKEALCERLPRDVARRLQVRIYQVSAEIQEPVEAGNLTNRKSGS